MIFKNFLTSPLIKNTLKLSSSNVILYFIPLVVTPILSRIYGPEPFGEWGVFSSVYVIANMFVFLGLENAIVKAQTNEEAADISVLGLIISFSLITLLYGVFVLGEFLNISFFVKFPNIHLLAICLYVSALCNVFQNISNRLELYGWMSISNVILGGSQAAFRIVFGSILVVSVNGLILGTVLAQIVNLLFFVVLLAFMSNIKLSKRVSFTNLVATFKNNKRFPLYDAPANILSFSAFNLPILILSAYFDKAEIGCYSMAVHLMLMPMSFIGSAMGRVYYRQLSINYSNIVQIRHITTRVLKITALLAIMPTLFIVLGGDKIIVLFLGTKWEVAGGVALSLSLWSFSTVLTQPLIPILRQFDKQSSLLKYNLMYFVGGIGSIIIMAQVTSNLLLILLVYAAFCSIAKICLFLEILSTAGITIEVINKKIKLLWLLTFVLFVGRAIYMLF